MDLRRPQWPRGLRRRSAASRLLRLWVRIPPAQWMFVVSIGCCRVEVSVTCWSLVQGESCRLWFVVVCDLGTSWMSRPWTTGGCRARNKTIGLVNECQDEWDIKKATIKSWNIDIRAPNYSIRFHSPLTPVRWKWLSNYKFTGRWWCLRRHHRLWIKPLSPQFVWAFKCT